MIINKNQGLIDWGLVLESIQYGAYCKESDVQDRLSLTAAAQRVTGWGRWAVCTRLILYTNIVYKTMLYNVQKPSLPFLRSLPLPSLSFYLSIFFSFSLAFSLSLSLSLSVCLSL